MQNLNRLYIEFMDELLEQYGDNPTGLNSAFRESLQRFLTYKELVLHSKELGEEIVSATYRALKPFERNFCNIGLEALTFIISKLDSVLALDWSDINLPSQLLYRC